MQSPHQFHDFTTDQFDLDVQEDPQTGKKTYRYHAEASSLTIPPGTHLSKFIDLKSCQTGRVIRLFTDWTEETDGEFWKYYATVDGKRITVTIWND